MNKIMLLDYIQAKSAVNANKYDIFATIYITHLMNHEMRSSVKTQYMLCDKKAAS